MGVCDLCSHGSVGVWSSSTPAARKRVRKALCAKTASAATPTKGTDSPAESWWQDKKPAELSVRAPFPAAPAGCGSPLTRRQSSSPDRQPRMQGIRGALSRPGFEFALLLRCKLRSVHAGKLVLPSKMKSSRCCSTSTAWPSCPLATSGTLEDRHDPSSLSYASQLTLGNCLLLGVPEIPEVPTNPFPCQQLWSANKRKAPGASLGAVWETRRTNQWVKLTV